MVILMVVPNSTFWRISGGFPFFTFGKPTKNYGKSPCYQWVNPLFLSPFSTVMLV